MERFKPMQKLGDGSFGKVFKAQEIETGEIYAIKSFRKQYTSWEEAMSNPEVKALI